MDSLRNLLGVSYIKTKNQRIKLELVSKKILFTNNTNFEKWNQGLNFKPIPLFNKRIYGQKYYKKRKKCKINFLICNSIVQNIYLILALFIVFNWILKEYLTV